MVVTLHPIKFEYPVLPGFGLDNLVNYVSKFVTEGDIVVFSSKLISYCENRLVKLSEVEPSKDAVEIGRKYCMDEKIAEVVLREADKILGGFTGFLLTLKFGILCPNAGVDTSNVPEGFAVLYPKDPVKSAKILKNKLKEIVGDVGVVITDSRILPLRRGVSGVALAACGFDAVVDCRGRIDIFGKNLKSTFRNLADMISSASQLLMGEADELTPAVIVRGIKVNFTDDCPRLSVDPAECLYRELFCHLNL